MAAPRATRTASDMMDTGSNCESKKSTANAIVALMIDGKMFRTTDTKLSLNSLANTARKYIITAKESAVVSRQAPFSPHHIVTG